MISLRRFIPLTLITSHKMKGDGIFYSLGIVLLINYYLFIWTVRLFTTCARLHHMDVSARLGACGPFLNKAIYLMD